MDNIILKGLNAKILKYYLVQRGVQRGVQIEVQQGVQREVRQGVQEGVQGPGLSRARGDRAKRVITVHRALPQVAADLPEPIARGR